MYPLRPLVPLWKRGAGGILNVDQTEHTFEIGYRIDELNILVVP